MVVTVEQSIPMNARGFFLRERDALNTQYGVQLKFPRGREFMHGNFQTMLMVGTQPNINAVMPQVRRILAEAQNQYESFKERQSRRRKMAPRPQQNAGMTSIERAEVSTRKPNPFAVLDGLHEQEIVQHEAELASRREIQLVRDEKKEMKKREKQAILDGTAPKPLPRPAVTMNYAAMAAKAKPVEPVVKKVPEKPGVKLVIIPKQNTVSWADMMSDDEDSQTGNESWNEDWSNMDWSEM